jgi:putative flippase GtrA
MTFPKFFLVSLGGVGGDISLAWTLYSVVGIPLSLSVFISLSCAAVLMYFFHEFWTFRRNATQFSFRRLRQFMATSFLVLFVRWVFLWIMHNPLGFGEQMALLQLTGAAGVSFLVNYAVSRVVIFR